MGRQQQPFLVEPAAAIETRLRGRHGLRGQWRRILNGYQPTYRDIAPLANHLGVATAWLMNELALLHPLGLLLERIEQRQQERGAWVKRWPLVTIEQAICDLRIRLDCLRRGHNCQQRNCTCYECKEDSLHSFK